MSRVSAIRPGKVTGKEYDHTEPVFSRNIQELGKPFLPLSQS
jgi:hypothetical protein